MISYKFIEVLNLSFKKTKVVNSSTDILLCFKEKIFPAVLNIRSQAAVLA